MEYIYGKLNKELELAEYSGLDTKTIHLNVDNATHKISADLLVNISGGSTEDALLFTKQLLNNDQINQVYSNLNLIDYLNNNVILQQKGSQSVTGNFRVNGILSSKGRYIYTNIDNFPLTDGGTSGLIIKNWKNDYDAKIVVDNEGSLYYDNGHMNQQILTKYEMTSGKFAYYYNGQSLTTKDILPKDINTKTYLPELAKDLTTKEYVDKAVRVNTNYAIVDIVEHSENETEEEAKKTALADLSAWEGRRVLILEEAIA